MYIKPSLNRKIVGKCSICGGVVSIPMWFMSVTPPIPTCEKCEAVKDETANLPTVPMKPRDTNPWKDEVDKYRQDKPLIYSAKRNPDLICRFNQNQFNCS